MLADGPLLRDASIDGGGAVTPGGKTEAGSRKKSVRPATGNAGEAGHGPDGENALPTAPAQREQPKFEDWLLGIV